MNPMIATLVAVEQRLNAALARIMPLADLLARLYLARVFLLSGWNKLSDWDTTLYLFREEYAVPLLPPEPAAILATTGELVLPVLLLAGLFTQPAALGLFVLNIVAVVSYYATLSQSPAALGDHLQWGILLGLLMCLRQRPLALDHHLRHAAARVQ